MRELALDAAFGDVDDGMRQVKIAGATFSFDVFQIVLRFEEFDGETEAERWVKAQGLIEEYGGIRVSVAAAMAFFHAAIGEVKALKKNIGLATDAKPASPDLSLEPETPSA